MGFFLKRIGKQAVKGAKEALVEELSQPSTDDDDDEEEERTFWEKLGDIVIPAVIFGIGVAVGSHFGGSSQPAMSVHIHVNK